MLLDHNTYTVCLLSVVSQFAKSVRWLLAKLVEDAAPHYCRHHHSASVPLCCLLLVSLTAVSQAPAYGRAHRQIMLTLQLGNQMFTIHTHLLILSKQFCRAESVSGIDYLSSVIGLHRGLFATLCLRICAASVQRKLLNKCCISLKVIKSISHKVYNAEVCCIRVLNIVLQ